MRSVAGNLSRISVGNAANVWGVNSRSQVFRLQGANFVPVPGKLNQIDAGKSAATGGGAWGVSP
jgi:hypothetical protein